MGRQRRRQFLQRTSAWLGSVSLAGLLGPRLLAKDAGGPDIKFQALIYPVTDFDFGTPSYAENANGYLLTKQIIEGLNEIIAS